MKWPASLIFVRHGESAYNVLKKRRDEDVEHAAFRALFERDLAKAEDETWPSQELKDAARRIWFQARLSVSDYNTPLTDEGLKQAAITGRALKSKISLPDAVYVSPYLRTRQTLEQLCAGWPELGGVKMVQEERIREQEHGLSTVFNDWRVYYVFHPLQALLYKLEGEYEYRFLNGENKADVRDRVRSFLSTLIREHAEQNVLVVSHHLTLLSLRANLERWDRETFIKTDKEDKPLNCGVTTYEGRADEGKNGKLILKSYNEKLY